MFSLKKGVDPDDRCPGLFRVVSILLRGIERYTIPTESPEYRAFQSEVAALRNSIESAHDEDARVLAAAEIVRVLEGYAKRAEKAAADQRSQFASAVRVLTETLTNISRGNDESIANLKSIQSKLEATTRSSDIGAINRQLSA